MSVQPRAVLWDMDGTLLDSAEYHWIAWHEILANEHYELSHNEFVATFGQRNDTILRRWLREDLPQSEIDRIGGAKEARYRELVRERGIELLPGVQSWLVRLKVQGWRQAIASAAPRLNVQAIIEVLQLGTYFDAISSADDVQRGKPDPQVFLVAAERLGVPPARAIVVEDAHAGVQGAHNAGMHAVAVRTTHKDIHADIVVDTMADLPADAFERLLGD